ncbi:MAG: hypothetical protein IKC46_08115 [Lachnospiraceae bacterium]|nr:hypothetical protein [Lachnospiraceae bacterium]
MKGKGITITFFILDILLIALSVYLYMQVDNNAPVITFEENEIVYKSDMDMEKLLEGVTAYDAVDGDVTESLIIEKVSITAEGEAIVTYAALDSSNNVVKSSRKFKSEIKLSIS